jgi:hypothetical protein
VHSSKTRGLHMPFTAPGAPPSRLFHEQLFDSVGNSQVGTFFTKAARMRD